MVVDSRLTSRGQRPLGGAPSPREQLHRLSKPPTATNPASQALYDQIFLDAIPPNPLLRPSYSLLMTSLVIVRRNLHPE